MYKNLNRDYWNEAFQPHYPKLIEFTEIAFRKMKSCKNILNLDSVEVDIKPKTCANAIHDIFEAHAKDYFNLIEGFVAGEFEGVFGVLVKEKCFLRFNKLNDDFSISNANTNQRKRFRNQYSIGFFSNEIVYLNFGYRVDAFWEEIKGIHLVCWNGTFEWEIDVLDEVNNLEQVSLDLQQVNIGSLQDRRRTILKKFNTKDKESDKQKSN